ncbi:MAG: MFS transporter [Simkaniaceae bacterium]
MIKTGFVNLERNMSGNGNEVIEKRQKLMILLALTACLSLLLLDISIVPVALPTIRKQLHFSNLMTQWVANTFLLVNASLVFAGGRLSDIFGHRKLFCLGLIVFGGGLIIAASAQAGSILLFARFVQGLGGAMMGPASYAILYDIFPLKERGRAVGTMVGISSIFVSIGPFIGGVFAECFSWRFIFLLQFVFVFAGLFLALKFIPKFKGRKERFDFPGFFALTFALGTLTLALMQGREWGWTSPSIMTLFLLSFLFFILLTLTNRISSQPFINISLLKSPLFLRGLLLLFSLRFIMVLSVLMPLFLQMALNLSPIEAGLSMMAQTTPVIFCGPFSGYLSDNFGPRQPALTGYLFITTALFGFAYFALHPHIVGFWIFLLMMGSGTSLIMTPLGTSTLSTLKGVRNGEAIGLYNSMRYTGGALGLTIMCTLLNNISYSVFKRPLLANPLFHGVNLNRLWLRLGDGLAMPLENEAAYGLFISGTTVSFASICMILGCLSFLSFFVARGFFRKFELIRQEKIIEG